MTELINYKDLCRICLAEQEKLINLLDKTNFVDKQYLDLMTECSSYNINLHERLPDHICSNCAEALDKYYVFRLRIIEHEKKLMSLLQDDKFEVKEEKDVEQEGYAEFLYLSDDDESEIIKQESDTLTSAENSSDEKPLVEVRPEIVDTNEFECGTCNKDVQGLKNFLAHLKTHASKCQVCLLKFNSLEELDEHVKSHPAEGARYSCKYCHKPFKQRRYMVLHWRTHTGERPYLCTHCGKTFAFGGNLAVHQRIHAGDKPYKCNKCDACFNQNSTLVTHQALHEDSEQEFSCKFCGKCFNRKYKVTKHELTHSSERKFPCSFCDKRFKEKIQRDRHKKEIHTEGVKFFCEICYKGFSRTRNLKIHIRTHAREKPYICHICDTAFSQKPALVTHVKKHGINKDCT